MFKAIGNLIHKTSWWGIWLAGISTLTVLLLFALPVQVIRMVDDASTPAERRAIQHEVGQVVAGRFLDVAQSVVNTVKERSIDPDRRRELARALTDIARARDGLAHAPNNTDSERMDRAREAAESAMETATEAAESAVEAAAEAREAVQEARADALQSLQGTGLDIAGARRSFDQLLDSARDNENAARDSLAAIRAGQYEDARAPAAPIPPSALQTSDASATVELSPERKYAIHTQVNGDVLRVALGSVLILTCIPLFLLVLIIKFLLGRSHHALALAARKTHETEWSDVSRQMRPTVWRRLWNATSKTHSIWARLLAGTFLVLIVVLLGALLAGLLALMGGWSPVVVGDVQLDGFESLAVGSVGLLVGFGACALALAMVLAVVYGLGFVLAALIVFIPTIVLLALFPVLAPLVLMVLGLWWLATRSRRNA